MTTTAVSIDRLRIETLRAIHALAEEYQLIAPKDVSMSEFDFPAFTSLAIQLPDGVASQVAGWAEVLGLPRPIVERFENSLGWRESCRAYANRDKPVWLSWNIVEVKCTVARGGAA